MLDERIHSLVRLSRETFIIDRVANGGYVRKEKEGGGKGLLYI